MPFVGKNDDDAFKIYQLNSCKKWQKTEIKGVPNFRFYLEKYLRRGTMLSARCGEPTKFWWNCSELIHLEYGIVLSPSKFLKKEERNGFALWNSWSLLCISQLSKRRTAWCGLCCGKPCPNCLLMWMKDSLQQVCLLQHRKIGQVRDWGPAARCFC